MSAGITVEDFKYVRGVNDAEYIELLKKAYEGQKYITSKAIAKLKKQPERKTGRWVSQKGGGYCCSECGRYALDEVDGNFIHVAFESNFCPYCGAKMERRTDGA